MEAVLAGLCAAYHGIRHNEHHALPATWAESLTSSYDADYDAVQANLQEVEANRQVALCSLQSEWDEWEVHLPFRDTEVSRRAKALVMQLSPATRHSQKVQ